MTSRTSCNTTAFPVRRGHRGRQGMTEGTYTPGHSQNATDFMARRSLRSHGEFFLPHLTPGVSVLDCGCGPGTITLGIAERIAPARVVGVDFGTSQIERATANAASAAVP